MHEFQQTAGDEAQAVFEDTKSLLDTAFILARQGTWHIGIGAGQVYVPLPQNAREGNGVAYRNARRAIARAKKSSGNIAYESGTHLSGLIEASLQLVMGLEQERNESWQMMGELYSQGLTQQEIAQQLGTYQSAISRALKQGRWQETRKLLKGLEGVMEQREKCYLGYLPCSVYFSYPPAPCIERKDRPCLKPGFFLCSLWGAVVLSVLVGPLESVGKIWVNLAVVGLGAVGGSIPAEFFVGKLQPRIQRETRDYQKVAGWLGFMRFRATVSSYQEQDEPDGGGRLIDVFERLAVVLCLLTS